MRNLLTDLCVEAEAHTLNAMYMARSFDQYYTSGSEQEQELFRIGVSVSKYYVTKRLPGMCVTAGANWPTIQLDRVYADPTEYFVSFVAHAHHCNIVTVCGTC